MALWEDYKAYLTATASLGSKTDLQVQVDLEVGLASVSFYTNWNPFVAATTNVTRKVELTSAMGSIALPFAYLGTAVLTDSLAKVVPYEARNFLQGSNFANSILIKDSYLPISNPFTLTGIIGRMQESDLTAYEKRLIFKLSAFLATNPDTTEAQIASDRAKMIKSGSVTYEYSDHIATYASQSFIGNFEGLTALMQKYRRVMVA